MASGQSNVFPGSSDEEGDFFAGFTVEEIGQLRQDRQRRQQQELLRDVDEEIDALIDEEPQESASNSDVEVFADDGDEETASNADSDDAPPNPLQLSNTLGGINVEEFSVRHGPSRDLGDNATAKDFFNLFINDEFLDEIVRHSIAYARSKGDATFVTKRAEISAYLGLNILIGIHELPQLAMYWDSDQFIGVEGFKKTIPSQRFVTLGKYFHLARQASHRWIQWLQTALKFWKACCLYLYNRGKFARTLSGKIRRPEKELVPCVRRLGENARKAKAAPSKHHTHVNSVAFLCVAKCGVKGLALMNGTAKLCRNRETELFLYCVYIRAIFIIMQSCCENDRMLEA